MVTDTNNLMRCFSLCIYEDEQTIRESQQISLQTRKNSRIMALYCHSPAVAFGSIAREAPRSIIITSGTLAPMDTFINELCIPFDKIKELPHVTNRVSIQVLSRFNGRSLNFEYAQRQKEENMEAVGQIILKLADEVQGGILVFFSCYSIIYKYASYWKRGDVWKKINEMKKIFIQAKSKQENQEVKRKYKQTIEEKGGALLLAVCKGKISEGLNFHDELGRLVIVVGIPFPSYYHPQIKLKKEFMNHEKYKSGEEWYRQEGIRAVNQAIGRVIRHKDDYGAILLIDLRYKYGIYKKILSQWLSSNLKYPHSFQEASYNIKKYLSECSGQEIKEEEKKREVNPEEEKMRDWRALEEWSDSSIDSQFEELRVNQEEMKYKRQAPKKNMRRAIKKAQNKNQKVKEDSRRGRSRDAEREVKKEE